MEERQKRKRFDKEFKISAVTMLLDGKQTQIGLSKELGINTNTLQNWKKQYLKDKEHSFPGKGYQTPSETEIMRLKSELARVTQQRDFLKKAAAYFAANEK
jgi:transposase